MDIQFLDDSGIDDKYFQRKDVLIHTLLTPWIGFDMKKENEDKDVKLYMTRTTPELEKMYDKSMIQKFDMQYAKMVGDKLIFIVQLLDENDIELSRQKGAMADATFCAFKDELLNASPLLATRLQFIDPIEFVLKQLN